jgi:hypothetical protein
MGSHSTELGGKRWCARIVLGRLRVPRHQGQTDDEADSTRSSSTRSRTTTTALRVGSSLSNQMKRKSDLWPGALIHD